MMGGRKILTGVAVAVVLALALGVLLAPSATAQTGRAVFRDLEARMLTVVRDGEVDLQGSATVGENADAGGDLTVQGDADVTGNLGTGPLAVTGNASVSGALSVLGAVGLVDDVNLVAQDAITVTNAATFTTAGGVQMIQAAGAVTPTLNSGSQGQVVTLVNISNQNITLADTTGQLLAGDWVGGQWDTLTLYFYGTSWIERTRSNN